MRHLFRVLAIFAGFVAAWSSPVANANMVWFEVGGGVGCFPGPEQCYYNDSTTGNIEAISGETGFPIEDWGGLPGVWGPWSMEVHVNTLHPDQTDLQGKGQAGDLEFLANAGIELRSSGGCTDDSVIAVTGLDGQTIMRYDDPNGQPPICSWQDIARLSDNQLGKFSFYDGVGGIGGAQVLWAAEYIRRVREVPEPGTLALLGLGLAGLGLSRRRETAGA